MQRTRGFSGIADRLKMFAVITSTGVLLWAVDPEMQSALYTTAPESASSSMRTLKRDTPDEWSLVAPYGVVPVSTLKRGPAGKTSKFSHFERNQLNSLKIL